MFFIYVNGRQLDYLGTTRINPINVDGLFASLKRFWRDAMNEITRMQNLSMKYLLKSLVRDILALNKNFPTELTDKNTLQSFIHKLFPLSPDKELIRLGPKGDGGYLVPDDLVGIEACFSPGVNLISGFEKDCADLGMKVFLADKSVEQPAESHDLFHFTKKFVGITTSDDFMTIDDWVASSLVGSQTDLMLQIDIEGYEYETFIGITDSLLRRFRIIVAEFHNIDQLWNRPFFRLASRAFEKILQTHTCIHIHPNNCHGLLSFKGLSIPRIAEFTFLRNDRICNPSYTTVFPHPLDCDNTNEPHLPLPKCWHSKL